MHMIRLNITLPDEIAKRLSKEGNKSRLIADALREKFAREKKKELDRLMLEGYKTSCQQDRKLISEWEKISLEKWD